MQQNNPRQHNPRRTRLRVPGLADRLKSARQSVGLSQEQVGERLGVNRRTVFMWEAGRAEPSVETLDDLAGLYGRPPEWFLGSGEMTDEELELEKLKRRIAALPEKHIDVVRKLLEALEAL